MTKLGVKIPKAKHKSLVDIYPDKLHKLVKRSGITSQAIYTSKPVPQADGKSVKRITVLDLRKSFYRIKKFYGPRLMAIRNAIRAYLCESGAGELVEKVANNPGGTFLEDGFWYLSALGFLKEGRRREVKEIISQCRGPEAKILIWQALAEHYTGKGDLEKAKRAVDGAISELPQGDTHALALGLCRLARLCAHLGIRDKGLELVGEVERIPVDGWPLEQITALLVSRSKSMLALGKQGEALRLAEEALGIIEGSIQEEIEDSKGRKARRIVDRERELSRLGALFVRLGCDQRSQRCLEFIRSKHYRQKFFIACARACIGAGRLKKAVELMEQISSPSVRLGLRLEMARFYHRHGLLGDEAIMLSEAEEEEKKLNIAIN